MHSLFKMAYMADVVSSNPLDKAERPKLRKGEIKDKDVDAYRYLSWLMSCAAGADLFLPDYVRSLLPWNAPSRGRAEKASPPSR